MCSVHLPHHEPQHHPLFSCIPNCVLTLQARHQFSTVADINKMRPKNELDLIKVDIGCSQRTLDAIASTVYAGQLKLGALNAAELLVASDYLQVL